MKTRLGVLAGVLFFIGVLTASGQVSQVQYEVIYNQSSCLYEAHAHVIGAPLVFPSTIPYPSKFTVVVPAAISNLPFTVVQSVNPPGISWSQSNTIYAPAADPASDFHAFTISGGGGGNAYPGFTVGADILLFKFSVPHVACEEGIRCFINGTDPNSAQPGMSGIDFTQAFKTYQAGVPSGVDRYVSNTGSPVNLPEPLASSSKAIACDGSTLYLSSAGSSILGCNNSVSYNWTGTGGFTSTLQNPVVSPFTSPGNYLVTVKDHNGCTTTSSVVLTTAFQALSLLTGTTPTCNGASSGSAAVTASGGTPGYSYLWNNGQVAATATGLAAGSYTVTVTDAGNCTAIAGATVTECANIAVSGFVLYNNDPDGGMNGVTVELRNSSNVLMNSTQTVNNPVGGQPGYYSFSGIANGTDYKLSGTYNGSWGGNNATDDLIVKLNTIGTYPLPELNEVVADVNGTGSITGLDALYITLRTVGVINAYPAGDWKFSEKTVAISGTPVTQDITALCEGDVNGSYVPGGSKAAASLAVVENGSMTVTVGESFVYNILSSRDAEVGAMTLFLGYDNNRYEVTSVNGIREGLKYVISDGSIAIAWADINPLTLHANDLVLSLNMKVKERIAEPSRVFTIGVGSELADMLAKPYDNFDLKMSGILTHDGSTDVAMSNYPNPFAGSTAIVYTLPEPGNVNLVLTDLYGKTIRTLANRQEAAGSHIIDVDPAALNLVPGVYLYRITFNNTTDSFVRVNKMVFTR